MNRHSTLKNGKLWRGLLSHVPSLGQVPLRHPNFMEDDLAYMYRQTVRISAGFLDVSDLRCRLQIICGRFCAAKVSLNRCTVHLPALARSYAIAFDRPPWAAEHSSWNTNNHEHATYTPISVVTAGKQLACVWTRLRAAAIMSWDDWRFVAGIVADAPPPTVVSFLPPTVAFTTPMLSNERCCMITLLRRLRLGRVRPS